MAKITAAVLTLIASASASNVVVETCANRHKNMACLPAQVKTASCEPEMCLSKPTSMTFVYTGGDCKHSYHMQKNTHFFCVDHTEGGAPSDLGTSSYIKVIDSTGGGKTTYHEDWVRVGSQFTLFNNGGEFDDSLVMTIYDQQMNLVQEIIYQVTCDGNMFLCDRFGSVELCGLTNDQQGDINSCPQEYL